MLERRRGKWRGPAMAATMLCGSLALGCGADDDEVAGPDKPRSWSEAELVAPGEVAFWTRVAIDGHGRAAVVWDRWGATSASAIWASRHDGPKGRWSSPEVIERADSDLDAVFPNVAFDASGNVVAAWHRQSDALDQISVWTNRYDAVEGTWGEAQRIENGDTGIVAEVAMDPAGHAFVTFAKFEGVRFRIVVARYDAEADRWGPARTVDDAASGQGNRPLIATDPKGNALVVWAALDLIGAITVWSARYDAGTGRWEEAVSLARTSGAVQTNGLAVNDAGNAVAVWQQADAAATRIWASRYDAERDVWEAAERISPADEDGVAQLPVAVIDEMDNAIVAWSALNGGREDVWASRYDAVHGRWEAAETLESHDANGFTPWLGIDRGGNAIAVWRHVGEALETVWTNRYDAAAGGWGQAEALATGAGLPATLPHLAVSPQGDAIVAWVRPGEGIYVNHYR